MWRKGVDSDAAMCRHPRPYIPTPELPRLAARQLATLETNSGTMLSRSPPWYTLFSLSSSSLSPTFFDYSIRALRPFYKFYRGAGSATVLFDDYTVRYPHLVIPLVVILHTLRKGHAIICFAILSSMATALVAVFLRSLQLSLLVNGVP